MTINPGLRILLAGEAIVLLAAAMLAPIVAIFVEDIGGSVLDAGITVGVFSLASAATTFLAGKYAADSLQNPKKMIVYGYILTGLGFMAMSFVQNVSQLLFVQFVIGIASPLYAPAFNALYSRHVNPKRAGFEWGLWDVTDYAATGIGAIVGGAVAHLYGFDPLFWAMGLLCLISAIYIAWVRLPSPS